MAILKSLPIFNQATAGVSIPFEVGDADTVEIQLSGSPTSFTAVFEGSLDGADYNPRVGDRISNTTALSSTTTSTSGESWEFDVSTLKGFRVNVTAMTGTNKLKIVANSTK